MRILAAAAFLCTTLAASAFGGLGEPPPEPLWDCDQAPVDPFHIEGSKDCEFIIPLGASLPADSDLTRLVEVSPDIALLLDSIDVRHPTASNGGSAPSPGAIVWLASYELETSDRQSPETQLDIYLVEASGEWRLLAQLSGDRHGAVLDSQLSPALVTPPPHDKHMPAIEAAISIEPPPSSAGPFGTSLVQVSLTRLDDFEATHMTTSLSGSFRIRSRTLGLIEQDNTMPSTLRLTFDRIAFD